MTTTTAAAASLTSMGLSTKGNPVVKVGNMSIPAGYCAETMLKVATDPAELALFVSLLGSLVASKPTKAAKKAAAAAAMDATPPVPVPVPVPVAIVPPAAPAQPSMSTAETLAAIAASRDTIPADRKAMRGKPVTQVLPTATASATIVKPVDEATRRAALIAEGRALGMKAISAYGLKMAIDALEAKVAANRPAVSPTVTLAAAPIPVPVKATLPIPTQVKRTLVEEFLVQLADGRELYTAVYDDDSVVTEISGTRRNVA